MLWHRVRNQPGAPTNAQAKAWLAQAPGNPPAAEPAAQPAGKMVMRNGKYVVVKPGEKKPKSKAAASEPEPAREPEPEPEPEPPAEEPKEADPEDDPKLSEQEKKAIRRAKEKARRSPLVSSVRACCGVRDSPPQGPVTTVVLMIAGGSRAAQSREGSS